MGKFRNLINNPRLKVMTFVEMICPILLDYLERNVSSTKKTTGEEVAAFLKYSFDKYESGLIFFLVLHF